MEKVIEANIWQVYDACAEWCAERGLQGKVGDSLPNLLSKEVCDLINDDQEAFERRVRQSAYARAMNTIFAD
jgi:hypothetical protein